MEQKVQIEYPALIYKNREKNAYIANCIMFNLIGFGRTEFDAISNLQSSMNEALKNYDVKVKPMYKLALQY